MNITAFSALHPDPIWYNSMMNTDIERQRFRQMLHPEENNVAAFEDCKVNLAQLKDLGKYSSEEIPGIYIYEKESLNGAQFGIWVLTSLEDMVCGNIITHERTLEQRENGLRSYREGFGLEASPVVLTYLNHSKINQLIKKIVSFQPIITLTEDECNHKVWKVKAPETIHEFTEAFQSIEQAYVADGHHRLAVALAAHQISPQWISTLYVSTGQIRCREFHRMIFPTSTIDTKMLLSALGEKFHIITAPNNIAYKPSKLGRLGMQHKGIWYQLDWKPEYVNEQTDVQILQEMVLSPLFGIHDPGTDQRLLNFPANKWEELLHVQQSEPESVTFTLFPITAEALIQQAQRQQVLPPKSTYIEPKVPFGLLLYQNQSI